jgi:hypothetical protein
MLPSCRACGRFPALPETCQTICFQIAGGDNSLAFAIVDAASVFRILSYITKAP